MKDIPAPLPQSVVKLIPAGLWPEIAEAEIVPPSALDEADGFMHLSTEEQMLETANRYYTDHKLVLALYIATAAVAHKLKWEPAAKRNNDLFPHLYMPCPRSAVMKVASLVRGEDDTFSISQTFPAAGLAAHSFG